MNVYIVVEGEQTEMTVYPAWLSIIAPNMKRVLNAREINNDSYYLFVGMEFPLFISMLSTLYWISMKSIQKVVTHTII